MKSRLTREAPHWEEYVRALNDLFGTSLYEDRMSALMKLKQIGTTQEYMDRFDELMNRLELTKTYAISCFLRVLKDEIAHQVRMFKLKTMQETISLVRLQEQALRLSSNKNFSSLNNFETPSHFTRILTYTPPLNQPYLSFPTHTHSVAPHKHPFNSVQRIGNQDHKPILNRRG
ncbi:UNVERIFIED_CONTAM: hypothetical protein Sradi_3569600 [Sesamum radiatum]|uniref:Retrotransposon gag domain-containing protein n=1 Tax=Sesamum radiatum TaxID=300843 RepID=A0AAW2QGE3_SESRA